MKTVRFEMDIARGRGGSIDPPRFERFTVEATETMSVLDALEQIRIRRDPTLVYRHSCHHSACGTCGCRINGVERLACTTRLDELGNDRITIEPLAGFRRIADLAVDMSAFYRDIDPHWSCLKPSEPLPGASPDSTSLLRLEDCIECGACVSACPAAHEAEPFMGPAALAALHSELTKNPAASDRLLAAAGSERGERRCRRALACSRVCPSRVYPARRIGGLRRQLSGRGPGRSRGGIEGPWREGEK